MSTYIGNTPEGAKNLQAQLPIGSVVAWPSSSIPSGWLECNGQSTTQYPILNTLIGATVPDLRGEFIRGYDHGKGTDSGRTLLSSQADEFKSHVHTVDGQIVADISTAQARVLGGNGTSNVDTQATGGTETRPVNVALMYIIKAFDVVSIDSTSGVYAANKNYIINPTFSVNQRGYDGTGTAGGYLFDRWIRNSTTTVSLPDASGYVTVGVSFLRQLVEGIGVEGIMTLSWEGTATADIQGDGTGDLADNPSPLTIDTTGLWNKGVDSDALNIRFLNGTLRNVKLELGSIVTPFEYPDFGTELAKCLRYYERWERSVDGDVYLPWPGLAVSTTSVRAYMSWTVKRIAPAVSWFSIGTVQALKSNGTAATATALSISGNTSLKGCRLVLTSTGFTAGASSLLALSTTGYIAIDAEL